ncbi:hypothetical protein LP032_088 [Listeria phage LP-032]|uniref:Uncharacterized protein n=2 Tax=Homburgvirus TaxID=1921125 RepID=A0A6C0QZZ0_9CAUD|nr:hypothetical protein LP032_088 [Listeria phage LP-032]QHZ59430.1 hypothetical protein FK483_0087 [Listeria phage LP-018]
MRIVSAIISTPKMYSYDLHQMDNHTGLEVIMIEERGNGVIITFNDGSARKFRSDCYSLFYEGAVGF